MKPIPGIIIEPRTYGKAGPQRDPAMIIFAFGHSIKPTLRDYHYTHVIMP